MDETLSVNTQEVAEPVQETQPETVESETGVKEAEPAAQPRDYDRDSAFAKMRREAEEARREAQRYQSDLDRMRQEMEKTLDTRGSDTADLLDKSEAYRTGRTVEEVRKERLAREKVETLERENRELKQKYNETVFEKDLTAIKQANPELKVKTIDELGPDFLRLRASGVDPIVAYAAINAKKVIETKPAPPSTGSVKSSGATESEYFTDDEVNALTPKQLDDPKILEKAMRSLTKKKG